MKIISESRDYYELKHDAQVMTMGALAVGIELAKKPVDGLAGI